ncbi:PREDICTED: squamosa promoter-binding-like protein 11 [Tarenaya hassleriana]|uniref:squamosa promoter-binding-like protein 11 n=1 Tax=Tarenaya hassleriana TaxID=28532 RepID=UPI00053C6344|nr:PREDICTED: squamosa promoter-binding-like protein 11 [Tarenaya hassleriana]
MDCNMRSPMQWDWENYLTMCKDQQLSVEWEIEGIESVFPCFSSSSSDSASLSPGVRTCHKLASESIPEDSCSIIEFGQVKASSPAQSFLGLKLGKKRTYRDDFCGGNNNNDVSPLSMKLIPSVMTEKSKPSGPSVQVPRCQVEGCDMDLSSSKGYHRKHRVCESHSKYPKVIVDGLECRFCQQCSRFHVLSEFDEKKRSCRKRLSHHNARRRKPQGTYPLNPAIIYERRQQCTNVLSFNTRSEQMYAWGASQANSGFTLSLQSAIGFSSGKSSIISFQLPGKGGVNDAQDHHALSLLSTTSSEARSDRLPIQPCRY